MKLEFHVWPPPARVGGQQTGRVRTGVLAIDTETGAAALVCSERSHQANQVLAEQRVQLLPATLPWSTR